MKSRIWIFAALVAAGLVAHLALLTPRIAQTAEDAMRSRVSVASAGLKKQIELIDAITSPRAVANSQDLVDLLKAPTDVTAPMPKPDERTLKAALSAAGAEPDLLVVANAQGAMVQRKARGPAHLVPPIDMPTLPLVRSLLEGARPKGGFADFDGSLYRVGGAALPGGIGAVVIGTLVDDALALRLRTLLDADVTFFEGQRLAASSVPPSARPALQEWIKRPGLAFGTLLIRLPAPVGDRLTGTLPLWSDRHATRAALISLDGVQAGVTVPAASYLSWLGRYQAFYLAALLGLCFFAVAWGLLPAGARARRKVDQASEAKGWGHLGQSRAKAAAVATRPPPLPAQPPPPPAEAMLRPQPPEPPPADAPEAPPEPEAPAAVAAPPPLPEAELAWGDGAPEAPAALEPDASLEAMGHQAETALPELPVEAIAGEAPLETLEPLPLEAEIKPPPEARAEAEAEAEAMPAAEAAPEPSPMAAEPKPPEFSFAGLLDEAAATAKAPAPPAPPPPFEPIPEQRETTSPGAPSPELLAQSRGESFREFAARKDADTDYYPGDEPTRVEPVSAALLDKLRETDDGRPPRSPGEELSGGAAPDETTDRFARAAREKAAAAAAAEATPPEPSTGPQVADHWPEPAPSGGYEPAHDITLTGLQLPKALMAPSPAPPAADADEAHWRDTFQDFLTARAQTGEAADRLSYEKFAAKLKKNREDLLARHNCRGVRFKVYVKDGKAAIKASAIK